MSFSKSMLNEEIWATSADKDVRPPAEQIKLQYLRAKSICKASGLTVRDIVCLSQKFWDFHFDCTIGAFANSRPDLLPLLASLERFEICGEFMLTELEHGLDARNLETTAHLNADGSFILHTPTVAAAKCMPPTTPEAGVPRVAVVFARLFIENKSIGIKPFLVPLSDSTGMRPGITSRALPIRPGTKPLDHAVTSFNRVRLPQEALLGSVSAPENARIDFLNNIWRVSIGTLSLSIMGISALKVGSYIALRYSQNRHVQDTGTGLRVPIFTFSTQQEPIVKGLVFSNILDSYARWTISEFSNDSLDSRVRHGIATAFKALVMRSARTTLDELSNRCGWQGLFRHNQISELALTFQGNSIAEGDTLVLCIRLASELLTDRYTLHSAKIRDCLLSRYERGMFDEARTELANIHDGHRSQKFNRDILPKCGQLVEAIGQRMAYEAAVCSGIDQAIIAFFEITCIVEHAAWFIENTHLRRCEIAERQAAALQNVLALLPQILDESSVKNYVTAPIVDEKIMEKYILELPKFEYDERLSSQGKDCMQARL